MNIGVWKKGLGLFACALVFAGSLGAMEADGAAVAESGGSGCDEPAVRINTHYNEGVLILPKEGKILTQEDIETAYGGPIRGIHPEDSQKGGVVEIREDGVSIFYTLELWESLDRGNKTYLLNLAIRDAAAKGCDSVDVYRALVKAGGDINKASLGVAVYSGSVSVVEALVKAGANPDAECYVPQWFIFCCTLPSYSSLDEALSIDDSSLGAFVTKFFTSEQRRCLCENITLTTPRRVVNGLISEVSLEGSRVEAWRRIKELFDEVPCAATASYRYYAVFRVGMAKAVALRDAADSSAEQGDSSDCDTGCAAEQQD